MACVVSAFYKIPSKFPVERYFEWIEPFLRGTSFPLVFFCDKELAPTFRSWRSQNMVVIELPFEEFMAIKRYGFDFWKAEKAKDHEGSHTPELYCTWYEKKEFVLRAIALNPFGSKKFVWCDAGILRVPSMLLHMDKFPITEKIPDGKMTLLRVAKFEPGDTVDTNFLMVNRVGGGVLAADAATWAWWSEEYDAMIQKYLASGRFVGKDQSMMASMTLVYPERCNVVIAPIQWDGFMRWFYLLFWLA